MISTLAGSCSMNSLSQSENLEYKFSKSSSKDFAFEIL